MTEKSRRNPSYPTHKMTTGVVAELQSATTRESTDAAGIEKPELDISYIPIICSAPLLYAHSHGFFKRNGLDVNLIPAPGWSGIKDLMAYDKVDASHMLAPQPLACSLGIDGKQVDLRLAAVQNINGQALTLAKKHLGINDVRDMKGFTFGVPYRFSMHYYLLCYFLAENGVDPLEDVTIEEVSPPRMPYYFKKGWLDGVFAPEPFNQIPVHQGTGFIYLLSKDIWPGHPCCSFATSQDFIDRCPNTYQAMLTSVLEAELALHRANPEQRRIIAREISAPGYLNQPDPVPVEQALSGDYPDGQGGHHSDPDRMDFIPHPWPEYGSWIISQMQRWAQLPGRVNYLDTVGSVFQDETREIAEALGFAKESKPKLSGVHPFTGEDPFAYMQDQPHCAFQEQKNPLPEHDLNEPIRQRLEEIISHLADIAGGRDRARLEITSSGILGHLELILNETMQNLRYAQEAVMEQKEIIEAQSQRRAEELRKQIQELSTPVLSLWEDILCTPLIGTLDSRRTQDLMEKALARMAEEKARVLIVDITGVPVIDTMVGSHLIRMGKAVNLMGSDAILTGISPATAQTIVQLGVDLSGIHTRATLAQGLNLAMDIIKRGDSV